jgi:hypothetical protein
MLDAFDILKKLPDGGIVWIESAKDVESARQRIELFSRYKPGEYIIFCQQTQAVLALPLAPFARETFAPTDCRRKKIKQKRKKETKKKPREFSEKPKTGQVIADIVEDIGRSIRPKH